jgi:Nicotinate phosphoribosyltransferase (NAPRTase) family
VHCGSPWHLSSVCQACSLLGGKYSRVQFELNGGEPVASSIPATEHSVMTAWPSEREAIENMIQHYGSGLFSVVMDSYDYAAVRSKVLISDRGACQDATTVVLLSRPEYDWLSIGASIGAWYCLSGP